MTQPNEANADATVIAENLLAMHASRFRILRCLGSGGMGDVHLAEDSKLRRLVAIKSIRPDMCKDEEIRKRIERECLLHAKIGAHPHIVTLFDRLEDGDRINLVMEYVDGETLQQLLERTASQGKRLSWKDGITIACQCLDALARIHSQGIVHRDIKPSNIMVIRDDSGEYCAKLMDFGIARPQAEDEQSMLLTKEGAGGPGTPIYMAPEQIDPSTFGPVTYATDVYAMGVMLYQIVSGKPPFLGSLTEIFNGHLNLSPPPPDLHNDPTIPPGIIPIINRALSKKPSARFPSARAFKDELQRLLVKTDASAAEIYDRTMPSTQADPNKTLSAAALESTEAERGATMLDAGKTGGIRAKTSGINVPLFLVGAAVALAVLLIAVAGYFWLTKESPEKSTVTTPTEQAPASEKPAKPTVETGPSTQPGEPSGPIVAAQPSPAPAEPVVATGEPPKDTPWTYIGAASTQGTLPPDTSLPAGQDLSATLPPASPSESHDSGPSIMGTFQELRQQKLSEPPTASTASSEPSTSSSSAGTTEPPPPPPQPKPKPSPTKPSSHSTGGTTESQKPQTQQDNGDWTVIRKEEHKVQ